jgi:hypothetical protein
MLRVQYAHSRLREEALASEMRIRMLEAAAAARRAAARTLHAARKEQTEAAIQARARQEEAAAEMRAQERRQRETARREVEEEEAARKREEARRQEQEEEARRQEQEEEALLIKKEKEEAERQALKIKTEGELRGAWDVLTSGAGHRADAGPALFHSTPTVADSVLPWADAREAWLKKGKEALCRTDATVKELPYGSHSVL